MLGDATGDDAAVMVQVAVDVQAHAVEGHPVAHPHADRGDLVSKLLLCFVGSVWLEDSWLDRLEVAKE